MKQRQAAQGFTLLELIVALALASLVALVGASALSGMLDFRQRSMTRSETRADLQAAERILRHEWAGRGLAVSSDGQSLEFDTLHPIGADGIASLPLARVRLACETLASDQLELLHYTSALPEPTPNNAPAKTVPWRNPQVLATGLQTCSFSFLTLERQADGRQTPRWITRWDAKAPPPQLMRLALSHLGADMPPVVYRASSKDAKDGKP